MRSLHDDPADAGVSLIEVVVAMFVFGVIVTGIVGGITTATKMTADNRWREVATNLASQDLDQVRLLTNPVSVSASTYTKTVSGRVFTIARSAAWASSGSTAGCGTDSSVVYRRVNVAVTWAGQLVTTAPVRSDMILAAGGPVADQATGTILTTVTGVAGGVAGVPVTITPAGNGAAAVNTVPPATDPDGCSMVQRVTPGTYTVSITQAAYRTSTNTDNLLNQVASPSRIINVVAGQVASVPFTYANQATFGLTYAANYPTAALPTNLGATLVDTDGVYLVAAAASSVQLYPYPGGYAPVAGLSADGTGKSICQSAEPVNWPAGTVNATAMASGIRAAAVYAAPGGQAQLPVNMGVVLVKNAGSGYISAVPAKGTYPGDPGCTTSPTYTFGNIALPTGTVAVALPYGTWTIWTGSSPGTATTQVASANLTATTNTAPNGVKGSTTPAGVAAGGIVTLDPRKRA